MMIRVIMIMMLITPAKDEEVLVLDGDQGERILDLQKQVET